MSIYSVPIKEWFLDEESPFNKELVHLRQILPHIKCSKCGGKVTEEKGWVSHAITWCDFEEQTFCSQECKEK